ncbi:hypothetical protein ACO22_03615 [Paracoccidioides brasiliensis]|uniref:Leucine Rich Repeat domain-containing protein n=1 Tax=Paracoccidioides brasiliensis TaxID=121759 RepID=A0A1D2JFH8_PARBR|nr:hypothetical protein ACO22_03615 [Paracoccidioides brasiliensis]
MDDDFPLPPPRRSRQRAAALPPNLHHQSNNFAFESSLPSSDPPLFSSDDFQSSTLENYHNGSEQEQQQQQQQLNATTRPGSRGRVPQLPVTRKRQYRGTWWGEEETEKEKHAAADKKRRTEFKDKRNLDSGVWLASDDSVESGMWNTCASGANGFGGFAAISPYGKETTASSTPASAAAVSTGSNGYVEAREQCSVFLRGPMFARSRQVDNNAQVVQTMTTVVQESFQHKQARKIISDCLEMGHEFIDISNLNMGSIPSGLLRPISQFTKYPVITEMDNPRPSSSSFSISRSPTNCDQFFSSFEPFLCLFMTNNQLKTLTAEVFELSNLSVLSVRHNELEQIPGSIRNLTKLRELNVAGNQLSCLPYEVLQLLQKRNTELRQLTVHPNPFVMPDTSNVAQWHCHVRQDGTFVVKEDEDTEPKKDKIVNAPPSPTEKPLAIPLRDRIPITIPVATGIVKYFDADGLPVDAPETNTNTNIPIPFSSFPSPPSLPHSFSRTPTPPLRELALRAYNRGPKISHLIDPDTFAGPAITLEHLKRAEKVRDAGGKRCSVCARSFVTVRAQWVEWWDCESYGNMSDAAAAGDDDGDEVDGQMLKHRQRGRLLSPLPFLREVCCWGCVPGL